MRITLPFLALVLTAHSMAEEAPQQKKKSSLFSFLPAGGQLKLVIFPNYNERRQLTSLVKANVVTLVKVGVFSGSQVHIESYNDVQAVQVSAELEEALFDQEAGLVHSTKPLQIQSERVDASGQGIHYSLKSGQGYMLGPATTVIRPAPVQTTMNPSPQRFYAAAVLGMSLISQPATAAPPPVLTQKEQEAIQADALPSVRPAAEDREEFVESVKTDLTDGMKASAAAIAFLTQAQLPVPDVNDAVPADKPKDFEVDPKQTTVIHCDGGFYFDSKEGVLVYLKNVTVKDPRFHLSGANELKIFFTEKKEEPGKKKPNDTPPSDKSDSASMADIGKKFGQVDRIVATGAILLDQIPDKTQEEPETPIRASGAIFTYNVQTKKAVLMGGYPWVVQEPQKLRSTRAMGVLNLDLNNNSFQTDTGWDTFLNLENMKKK